MEKDINYLNDKQKVKKELERLDDKKTKVKENMKRIIEAQESIVSLLGRIQSEDPSTENDDKFAECYEKIKNNSNSIQDACIQKYNEVCKEYEAMEEEFYLLENAEIEDNSVKDKETEEVEDEERYIWIRD